MWIPPGYRALETRFLKGKWSRFVSSGGQASTWLGQLLVIGPHNCGSLGFLLQKPNNTLVLSSSLSLSLTLIQNSPPLQHLKSNSPPHLHILMLGKVFIAITLSSC